MKATRGKRFTRNSRLIPFIPILLLAVSASDGAAPNGEVDDYRIVIDEGRSGTPDREFPRFFRLYSCVPNPFNPAATIRFDLPEAAPVCLIVHDVAGRRVRTLLAGEPMAAGRCAAVWLGRDDAGREVPAGVYFYRLRAGGFGDTRRMTLVK